MDITIWFFITSGLFLGWSLGANHAVNVFGTAVASKMVRFRVAALIAGVFVILGAVFSGAGTTRTLTDLGSINALAGSFAVALAVGIAVTAMTKAQLPVSTSQAVIGAIIGWNLFTGSPTDENSLLKILFSWVASPILAALLGFLLFKFVKRMLQKLHIHLLELDKYTRLGLIVVGAMASYSLGANNIGNVMGMFASAPLFADLKLGGLFTLSGAQQLFFLGGVAIAVGIYTYGERVMATVGKDLYKISPLTGLVVVFAEFLVLMLFTSEELEALLISLGLPSFPLVPLSTTQAFIGAVIGVGLAKDPRSINFKVLGKIAVGWAVAPVSAGIITFFSLFFIQNVFEQKVVQIVPYRISPAVVQALEKNGFSDQPFRGIQGKLFRGSASFRQALLGQDKWTENQLLTIFSFAELDTTVIDSTAFARGLDGTRLTSAQLGAVKALHKRVFPYHWQLDTALAAASDDWRASTLQGSEPWNKDLQQKRRLVFEWFKKK